MLKSFKITSRTTLAVKKRREREKRTGKSFNPSFMTNHVEPQIMQIKTKSKILTNVFSAIFVSFIQINFLVYKCVEQKFKSRPRL